MTSKVLHPNFDALLVWPLAGLAICLSGLARMGSIASSFLATGAIMCVLLALWLVWRHWRAGSPTSELIGMVTLHGIVFTTIWLVIPVSEAIAVMAVILAILVLNAVWLSRRISPMPPATWSLAIRHAPFDMVIVAFPAVLAMVLDGGAQARFLAGDYPEVLLKYLVWAWFQLFLFLDLPVRLMRQHGVPNWLASLTCAVVFALLHLPNPVLMLATGMVMAVFSWQYQRGRTRWVLVLLMAVAATTLKIAVPTEVSGELRIGVDYLEHTVGN